MMDTKGIQYIRRFFALIRDVWLITGMTILVLFLGHYILGASYYVKDLFPKDIPTKTVADTRIDNSPVYANFPEIETFWKEQGKLLGPTARRFEPYYHWRKNGFAGEYTNVSPEGVRLTVKKGISAGAQKVFMFGGSTMWGTGSPDATTIPSISQSLLGSDYDVYNFGEDAYVSAQELNYLLYQLSVGNIPDIVIFYDGVNDGYAGAYSPAIPRDPQAVRERERKLREKEEIEKELGFLARRVSPMIHEMYEMSNYQHLVKYVSTNISLDTQNHLKWDEKVEESIESNGVLVVDMYEAHIRQAKALSREYGFRVLFFWQPNLFSLTRKTNWFESKVIKEASPVWVKSQQEVYKMAKERLSNREYEDIYFLGNIFDEVDEAVYIDWCHLGAKGNEIVAREISQRIEGNR